MTANELQKDQMLQAVIDYCENGRSYTVEYLQQSYWLDASEKTWCDGWLRAYEDVIGYCKRMLEKEIKDAD